MIVHEARKRIATGFKEPLKALSIAQEIILAKILNVQGREEIETSVARAIYACGIPFQLVWSPYW